LRAKKHLKGAVIGTDAPVIEPLMRQRGRGEDGSRQGDKRCQQYKGQVQRINPRPALFAMRQGE